MTSAPLPDAHVDIARNAVPLTISYRIYTRSTSSSGASTRNALD
jgi:hypothetical protein